MQLKDSRILLTGGSAGIGLAIAEACLDRGARVVINGRDPSRLEAAGVRLGIGVAQGDVGEDAARIVSTAVEHLGGLDVLVNNAAWGHRMTLEDLDATRFEAMWRTNVLGATLMAQRALPHLRTAGGGSIINISSTAGRRGYAGGSAYVSTKFALRGLTECWQGELRREDIRVILINPSEVQTGFGGRDSERQLNLLCRPGPAGPPPLIKPSEVTDAHHLDRADARSLLDRLFLTTRSQQRNRHSGDPDTTRARQGVQSPHQCKILPLDQ